MCVYQRQLDAGKLITCVPAHAGRVSRPPKQVGDQWVEGNLLMMRNTGEGEGEKNDNVIGKTEIGAAKKGANRNSFRLKNCNVQWI